MNDVLVEYDYYQHLQRFIIFIKAFPLAKMFLLYNKNNENSLKLFTYVGYLTEFLFAVCHENYYKYL